MGALQDLKKLEKQLKKAREEVERLELELEDQKKWPQEGDTCFKLSAEGTVVESTYSTTDSELNPLVIPYKSEEEALKEINRRQATIQVIRRVAELNDGWYPNWSKLLEQKWYVGINKLDNTLYTYKTRGAAYIPDVYTLQSGKAALLLVTEMEEELLTILG